MRHTYAFSGETFSHWTRFDYGDKYMTLSAWHTPTSPSCMPYLHVAKDTNTYILYVWTTNWWDYSFVLSPERERGSFSPGCQYNTKHTGQKCRSGMKHKNRALSSFVQFTTTISNQTSGGREKMHLFFCYDSIPTYDFSRGHEFLGLKVSVSTLIWLVKYLCKIIISHTFSTVIWALLRYSVKRFETQRDQWVSGSQG